MFRLFFPVRSRRWCELLLFSKCAVVSSLSLFSDHLFRFFAHKGRCPTCALAPRTAPLFYDCFLVAQSICCCCRCFGSVTVFCYFRTGRSLAQLAAASLWRRYLLQVASEAKLSPLESCPRRRPRSNKRYSHEKAPSAFLFPSDQMLFLFHSEQVFALSVSFSCCTL